MISRGFAVKAPVPKLTTTPYILPYHKGEWFYIEFGECGILDEIEVEDPGDYMPHSVKHFPMFSVGEERVRERLVGLRRVTKVHVHPLVLVSFNGDRFCEALVLGFLDTVGGEVEVSR